MMRKTICLITNWYPTDENPYRGMFFKDQAFAVKEYFDFIVIHYNVHIYKILKKKYNVSLVHTEENTFEYMVDIYVPIINYLFDLIKDIRIKHIDFKTLEGVGEYTSNKSKKWIEKQISSIYRNEFKDKFDVLYCVDAQKEAFILNIVSNVSGKPYILGEHAPVPWPGETIKDINKFAIEKANLFFAISNDKVKQILLNNIKLPKTIYLGNLVDENKFNIRDNASNGIKTIIIVAANSFYKNYDMFIKTMRTLNDITNYDFRIRIIGYAANKGYSKNIEQLENRIKESNFYSKTTLIPKINHDEIADEFHKADVFVMTSIQEGQPVAALEAACCGLPIFSTRCGGVEDYIDEENGRIYKVGDYEELAYGLKDFIENKIVFDRNIIRRKVVNIYGTNAFINNFVNSVNNVIER